MRRERDSRVHSWDGGAMYEFALRGDELEVTGVVSPFRLRRADEVEKERRLYLRLQDAVRRTGGEVALKPDWPQRAVDFANLYAPPIERSEIPPRCRIPVSLFGREALLMWWALRLKELLDGSRRGTIRRALEAVMQVRHLFPASRIGLEPESVRTLPFRVRPFISQHWRFIIDSVKPPSVPYRPAASDLSGWEVDVRELEREADAPYQLPDSRVRTTACLSEAEAGAQAKALFDQHRGAEPALWATAESTLANVLNVRLSGIALVCLPSGLIADRPGFSFGFHFLTPLSRIWYGLWVDIGGLEIRRCEECDGFYGARLSRGQHYCGTTCANRAHSRKHYETHHKGGRAREAAQRQGAMPSGKRASKRPTPDQARRRASGPATAR